MSDNYAQSVRTQEYSEGPQVAYMVRRETHSSRAITAVVVALVLIAGLVFLAVEGILSLSGQQNLLLDPSQIWPALTLVTQQANRLTVSVIAVVLILLGVIILGKALLPGQLGRHSIKNTRVAYIVDDAVIASDLSQQIRQQANLNPGQVITKVYSRKVEVHVTPTSGYQLDENELERAARKQVESFNLDPKPSTQLKVCAQGKVTK